jgi:hypothetical protein
MLIKSILRGRLGFWLVGKNYLLARDKHVARFFVLQEQKRIVNLIETMMEDYEQGSEEFDVLADAVALIKGEDK